MSRSSRASSSSLSGIDSPPTTNSEITLSPAARKSAADVAAKILASTQPAVVPKKRGRAAAVKAEPTDELDDPAPVVKKPRARKVKAEDADEAEVGPAEEDGEEAKPKRKPRKKAEPKLDEDGNPIKRRRALKPEPVYVIPEVQQHLSTAFRGRLGYACLNTILRKKKPEPIFCSRTLRIATIKEKGVEYMKELGKQNTRDLATLIQWNEDNNIRFMRISSELFPFASHEEYGYTLDYAREELEAAGALARKYGHRMTTHPGQYTQLGSATKKVVENAKRDLIYHCEILDTMGMGSESVMIIHGGGVYGSKEDSMNRFRVNFKTLPKNVRDRLVLENDEMCYNSDDLLPVCEELEIPHVFDYHHDWIYPSSVGVAELMPRILATWNVRGGIRPKMHLSEPRPGAVTKMERRGHSDRIKRLPDVLPPDVDLMLEAKDKEQAVLECYRIYGLAAVKHESLRPPAEVETLATNGRKSHKKKASKTEDGEDDDADADADADISPIKRKRAEQKRALAAAGLIEEDEGVLPNLELDDPTAVDVKPKAKRGRQPAAAANKPIEAELVEEKPEVEPPAAKTKRRSPKKAVVRDDDDTMEE